MWLFGGKDNICLSPKCNNKRRKDQRLCDECQAVLRDEMKRRGLVAEYDPDTGLYDLRPDA